VEKKDQHTYMGGSLGDHSNQTGSRVRSFVSKDHPGKRLFQKLNRREQSYRPKGEKKRRSISPVALRVARSGKGGGGGGGE